jgi:DNA modification methylase
MSVQLLHGDCLDLMAGIPDGSVDMILADLPYGTTACKWDTIIPLDALWAHYKRVIKRNGAIVLTASQPFTSALVMSNPQMFRYEWVWEKDRASGFLDANRRPLRAHENILVFAGGQTTYNALKTDGHKPSNYTSSRREKPIELYGHYEPSATGGRTTRFPRSVVKVNTVNGSYRQQHPTQKPVALMEYLIRTYTNEGETVLDNTMGSGTTGVACVNTNRAFIGMELDAGYFQIAQERIRKAQEQARQLTLEGVA